MRETRSSGSVEGVMGNHDSYSDLKDFVLLTEFSGANQKAGLLFLSRLTHFIPHVLTVRTQETSLP